MRDPARIGRIIKLITNIWIDKPDMRFGQLYESLLISYLHERGIVFNSHMLERTMFMMEDTDFEIYLQNFDGTFKSLVKK